MEDRRIFERIDARFPVRFLDPSSGREGRADTVDISANGVGFVTPEALSVNTPLEMWLDIPDQNEPLYARGEVVWSRPYTASGKMRFGVQLEKAQLMGLARALWVKK